MYPSFVQVSRLYLLFLGRMAYLVPESIDWCALAICILDPSSSPLARLQATSFFDFHDWSASSSHRDFPYSSFNPARHCGTWRPS